MKVVSAAETLSILQVIRRVRTFLSLPNWADRSVRYRSRGPHLAVGCAVRLAVGLCILGLLFGGGPGVPTAVGQSDTVTRTAGTVANLFESLDPSRPVTALRLSMPGDWTVESVTLLRYGTEPVPVEWERTSGTAEVSVRADRPLRGPHEIVVRVRLPDATGERTWEVRLGGEASASPDGGGEPVRQRVALEAPSTPSERNRALAMAAATEPVLLRPAALPFETRSSFSISFWMRTTGLNEVVFSTWSGSEEEAYPAEVMVDRSGRLRFYMGESGSHQALWTHTPVADGQWHHVAVVYDADRERLRLGLNGTTVDSLRNHRPPFPATRLSVALGGRPNASPPNGEGAPGIFSGRLDEVWMSDTAYRVSALEHGAARTPSSEEGILLRFEEAPDASASDAVVEQWPRGARRRPSTRSLQAPLGNIRAQSDDASVSLRWTAQPGAVSAFVVERSTDRERFEPVARLRPEEARRTPTEEAPEYGYTDASVPEEVVYYRVREERHEQTSRTTATIKVGMGPAPEDSTAASLLGNFPNPFRERTTIEYEVHEPTPLSVSVWTVTGTRVSTIADERHDAGHYERTLEAANLPSGSYFVQLKTPSSTQSHRMVVLR
ncbi:MAG: LamG-like jellyroll fold domain-containing protein [Salinibacter sp.]